MKTKLLSTLAASALAGATSLFGMGQPGPSSPATVAFLEPEGFTDFRLSDFGSSSERDFLEKEFRTEIDRLAGSYLPPGYHLDLRFRDIDMAGDFEPWRGPRLDDVRIVREIYPPRLKLEYAVTNPAGEVVASGERTLSDTAFLWRVRINNGDPLVYETELMRDLIREIGRSLG